METFFGILGDDEAMKLEYLTNWGAIFPLTRSSGSSQAAEALRAVELFETKVKKLKARVSKLVKRLKEVMTGLLDCFNECTLSNAAWMKQTGMGVASLRKAISRMTTMNPWACRV